MMRKKKTGNSRWSTKVANAVVASVRNGAHVGTAARAAGLPASTVKTWVRRGAGEVEGQRAVEPYRTFATRIREAEALYEARLVGIVEAAAVKDWRAASFLLRTNYRTEDFMISATRAPRCCSCRESIPAS